MIPHPPRPTLFPYTTLFRSRTYTVISRVVCARLSPVIFSTYRRTTPRSLRFNSSYRCRSEEHTSELQSLRHLVCRLLLEKKQTALRKRTPCLVRQRPRPNSTHPGSV